MECKHKWIVTTNDDNDPKDVMCEKCKEIRFWVDYKTSELELLEEADTKLSTNSGGQENDAPQTIVKEGIYVGSI